MAFSCPQRGSGAGFGRYRRWRRLDLATRGAVENWNRLSAVEVELILLIAGWEALASPEE